MILVEIVNDELRASLARFLDAHFPGDLFDREAGLALDFRAPAMSPGIEVKLVERLLQAWHTQDEPSREVELLLTASPSRSFASDEQTVSIQRRLHFTDPAGEAPPPGL